MSPHEEFLELCAVSISAELTELERRRLDDHLLGCASCREALKQFQETVRAAVPAIAPGLPHHDAQEDASWSQEKAEAKLFERLSETNHPVVPRLTAESAIEGLEALRRPAYSPSRFDWRQMWMSYAAAILLFLALAISAYRVGIRKGVEVATNTPLTQGNGNNQLEEQVSDLSHDRETLRGELAARDKTIADLKKQLEIVRVQEKELSENSLPMRTRLEERSAEEAEIAKSRLAELQKKLETEEQTRSEETSRVAALEGKLGELTRQLHERDEAIEAQNHRLESREGTIEQQQTKLAEQQELLDHDRDIRELMGARDLYLAEVFDVGKNGATQKSFGRIFLTKGKSLVFYAYDLDRQPGLKNASTFQAWGQRGTDREQALNLGVFFEDSASKKRWVLKFDDPQKLAQIDAVFVTVEPNGGSHKPSGKPFLFAYLKVNPNHP